MWLGFGFWLFVCPLFSFLDRQAGNVVDFLRTLLLSGFFERWSQGDFVYSVVGEC